VLEARAANKRGAYAPHIVSLRSRFALVRREPRETAMVTKHLLDSEMAATPA
jgi:hypothetical protein